VARSAPAPGGREPYRPVRAADERVAVRATGRHARSAGGRPAQSANGQRSDGADDWPTRNFTRQRPSAQDDWHQNGWRPSQQQDLHPDDWRTPDRSRPRSNGEQMRAGDDWPLNGSARQRDDWRHEDWRTPSQQDWRTPRQQDWHPPDGDDRRPRRFDHQAGGEFDEPGYPQRKRRRRQRRLRSPRTRLVLRLTVVAAGIFALVTTWSLGSAITNPGMGSSVAARAAEWARDHYLGPLVTLGEWISYQPPKVGGKPAFSLASGLSGTHKPTGKAGRHNAISLAPPHRLKAVAGTPLAGEGVWRVLASVHGIPAIWGTYLRPSNIYTSYVSGIVSMNQQLLRFQLRPGAEDPGPGNWHAQPSITPGTRTGLLATFNGGFKIASAGGGFYLNGATQGSLQPGAASVVYYQDGHLAIGAWDQTVRMTPQVVGVRQNLKLIISSGKIPASVDYNVESSWGATLGGSYYVWRSGIGITKTGRIIFAYGPALNVRMLAELLQNAGAVTAMQLDINPEWMSYMYYQPGSDRANPTPHNLLPDQNQPADRYYSVCSRDFTAVYAR